MSSAARSFYSGPFTITILNVIVTANASLRTERDGKIRTNEIDTDIHLSRMSVSFSNLGFFANLFQSFANSAGNMVGFLLTVIIFFIKFHLTDSQFVVSIVVRECQAIHP